MDLTLKENYINSFKKLSTKEILEVEKKLERQMYEEIRKTYNNSYGSDEEIDFFINVKKYIEPLRYVVISCIKDDTLLAGHDFLVETNKGILRISIKKDEGFDWFNPSGTEVFKNEKIRNRARFLSSIKTFSKSEEETTRKDLVDKIVESCLGRDISNLLSDRYISFIEDNKPDYIFVYKKEEIKIIKYNNENVKKENFIVVKNTKAKYNIKIVDKDGKHCFSFQIKRCNGITSGYRHNFWCCKSFKEKYFKELCKIRRV